MVILFSNGNGVGLGAQKKTYGDSSTAVYVRDVEHLIILTLGRQVEDMLNLVKASIYPVKHVHILLSGVSNMSKWSAVHDAIIHCATYFNLENPVTILVPRKFFKYLDYVTMVERSLNSSDLPSEILTRTSFDVLEVQGTSDPLLDGYDSGVTFFQEKESFGFYLEMGGKNICYLSNKIKEGLVTACLKFIKHSHICLINCSTLTGTTENRTGFTQLLEKAESMDLSERLRAINLSPSEVFILDSLKLSYLYGNSWSVTQL